MDDEINISVQGKNKKYSYALSAVFIAAFLLCLWRCSYGFSDDEPFYFTIPLRIIQGDSFISDEWHLSQFSSFFLVPYVYIFRALTGGTEGILVTARYIYVIIHFSAALFVWYRFRAEGLAAYVIAISFALFAPHGIMTYYYNTIAVDSLVLAATLLASSITGPVTGREAFASGVFFSVAVLCCPYLVIVFALFIIVGLIFSDKKPQQFFGRKVLLLFCLGTLPLAILFLSFLFSRTDLAGIMQNLPLILADPEHPLLPFRDRCVTIFFSIWRCHPLFQYAAIFYLLLLLTLALDKKRHTHKEFYLILSVAVSIFCFALYYPQLTARYCNAIMMPLIFPGFVAYILCENKSHRAFVCFFALGILYAGCLCFSSNLFFLVIPVALSVSNIGSMLFISELVKETGIDRHAGGTGPNKLCTAAVCICMATLLSLQFILKFEHSYYQFERNLELEYYIDKGPAKGTYTDEAKYSAYMTVLEDIEEYRNLEGRIAFLTVYPWCYLYTDELYCGTYSAWLSGESDTTLDRLAAYWDMHPDMLPDYVYMPKLAYFNPDSFASLMLEYGYTVKETASGYHAEQVNAADSHS